MGNSIDLADENRSIARHLGHVRDVHVCRPGTRERLTVGVWIGCCVSAPSANKWSVVAAKGFGPSALFPGRAADFISKSVAYTQGRAAFSGSPACSSQLPKKVKKPLLDTVSSLGLPQLPIKRPMCHFGGLKG